MKKILKAIMTIVGWLGGNEKVIEIFLEWIADQIKKDEPTADTISKIDDDFTLLGLMEYYSVRTTTKKDDWAADKLGEIMENIDQVQKAIETTPFYNVLMDTLKLGDIEIPMTDQNIRVLFTQFLEKFDD